MSRNTEATDDVKTWTGGPLNYKEGFFTQLATDELAKGINEEVVRAISAKRNEPEWMLEFRLNAYHAWLEMEEPHWLKAHYDKLNYQDYSYYSAPSCGNCDDNCASEPGAVQQTGANAFLSKEVEAAFEQLGVPVREGKEVAVDAISTLFRLPLLIAKNWRSRELFFVPLARRSTITRNWCVNISAPWCRGMTTSLPHLMRR